MKTSRPMTMTDAARYLRGRAYFRTVRVATEFLRNVRHRGHGDRDGFSVDYTTTRRFVVMEDEPGDIAQRLEELRAALRAENISYGELAELQALAPYIEPGDTELLEPAGVPEFPEESESVEAEQDRIEALVREAEDSPFLRRNPPVTGTPPERTPCDDGEHGKCPGCDCPHHTMGWMTQVDQFLHGG